MTETTNYFVGLVAEDPNPRREFLGLAVVVTREPQLVALTDAQVAVLRSKGVAVREVTPRQPQAAPEGSADPVTDVKPIRVRKGGING